jgi:hypothetical protein
MRNATAGWMICLAASFGLAATVLLAQSQSTKPAPSASAVAASNQITPLNMKTGLWQTTMTGKYTGLPPQIAAALNPTHTYKTCTKPEELTRNEWAKGIIGLKCSSVTVLRSTATDTDIAAKGCEAGNGMTAEGHGKFHLAGSGQLTGTMDVTFTGNTPFGGNGPVQMHSDFNSTWIGASCPADLQ